LIDCNLGQFAISEAYLRRGLIILMKFLPTHVCVETSLDFLAKCYHQQGRTEDAVTEIKNYIDIIEPLQEASVAMRRNLWSGCGLILFVIGQYEKSKEHYEKALTFPFTNTEDSLNRERGTKVSVLAQLAQIACETDKEQDLVQWKKAIESVAVPTKISTFREGESYPGMPRIHSKYLTTWTGTLKDGKYSMKYKINRTRPARQEGDVVLPEDKAPRKLTQCFVTVQFQNTAQPFNEDGSENMVEVEKAVNSYEFAVESPNLGQEDADKWYWVNVTIYSDERKLEKLGTHNQPIHSVNSLQPEDDKHPKTDLAKKLDEATEFDLLGYDIDEDDEENSNSDIKAKKKEGIFEGGCVTF